jgi:hypothetical protein
MRVSCVALTAIVLVGSPARADDPIVVTADLGIGRPVQLRQLLCYPDHASQYRPALGLDIAYRFIDQLAAGVHAGGRTYPWEECGGNIPGAYQMYRGIATALELGVVAQWSMNRFWAAGWLGVQDAGLDHGGRRFAYSFVGGVDAYVSASGHRIGASLELMPAPYAFVSLGIAYRYW